MAYRILVIDDETAIREAIRMTLEYEGYKIDEARSGQEGLDRATKTPYDAILLYIKMAIVDGIEVLENFKKQKMASPVIMVSGHGDVHTAVECTKRGAYDFLEKPLNREKLLLTVRNAVRVRSLEEENIELREKAEREYQLVGESQQLLDLKSQIERAAPTKATVLIAGESGTGKELVAREIHRSSSRADKLFVQVNCAAIPEELIDAELFAEEHNYHPKKFPPVALRALQDAPWRGNVRELRNMIERLVIMVPADAIDITDLPAEFFRTSTDIIASAMKLSKLQEFKDEAEKAFIIAKLREFGWNVSRTSEEIDTPRSNLYKKIEQYNIKREAGAGFTGFTPESDED